MIEWYPKIKDYDLNADDLKAEYEEPYDKLEN